jgi:hypothetical protein
LSRIVRVVVTTALLVGATASAAAATPERTVRSRPSGRLSNLHLGRRRSRPARGAASRLDGSPVELPTRTPLRERADVTAATMSMASLGPTERPDAAAALFDGSLFAQAQPGSPGS